MIPQSLYEKIVESVPLVCVDILLRSQTGKYLLVKRKNEPLKGEWWVIGGRVQLEETCEKAALRKLKEEAGIELSELKMIGLYEDVFDKNSFKNNITYHTVSMIFAAKVSSEQCVKLDSQSSEWGWFDELPNRLRVQTFEGNIFS